MVHPRVDMDIAQMIGARSLSEEIDEILEVGFDVQLQPSDLFENSLQGIVAFEAQAGSQPDSQAVLQLESESKAQQSDECICDDVCCLSSASLSQLRAGLAAPQLASVSAQADAGYLSITLDLVLPPPNIS